MPNVDSNGAIQSLVSRDTTPELFTGCYEEKEKNVNNLRCQLQELCEKSNETLSLSGTTLTITDEAGDTSSVDLSSFLDNTDTTYTIGFDVTANQISLIGSDGSDQRVTIDFNFSLLTPQQCSDMITSCSTELEAFVKSSETNTTLSYDGVNHVLTYTNESGVNSTVSLLPYLDDTTVTVVSGVLDSNTGIVTFTRDDNTTFTADFSALLDDTNDFVTSGVVSGTDLVLTRDSGTTVTVDLSGFGGGMSSSNTGNIVATYVDQTGTLTNIEETVTSISLNGNGDGIDYTDESGNVTNIDLSGLQPTDSGGFTLDGVTNVLTHTNSDGTQQNIDLSPYLDDTNDFVTSGVVSGTDLVLTRDSGTTVTVDLSQFDNTSVVVSDNTASNVNLIATHEDGNGNTVSIVETVTSLSLNGNGIDYTDETGVVTNIDLSGLQTTDNGGVSFDNSTNILTHTNSNGTQQTIDLSHLIDDTNLSRVEAGSLSSNVLTLTRGDGSLINVDLSPLSDVETTTTLTLTAPNVYTYTSEDGSTTSIDLNAYVTQPSTVTNTIIGNRIATHNDGEGSLVNINETVTTINMVGNVLTYQKEDGSLDQIDLSLYLDDTNLARIINGVYDSGTGEIVFTRDDATTFSINLSALVPTETLTTIVDNGDNSFTYTDENGDPVTITLSETVTDLTLFGNTLVYTDENGTSNNIDLTPILPTNLPFITSGQFSPQNLTIEFTRNDGSTFSVDVSGMVETSTSLTNVGLELTYAGETNTDVVDLETEIVSEINDGASLINNALTTLVSNNIPTDQGAISFDETTNEVVHTTSGGVEQRAEVCVGQLKVKKETFDITAGVSGITVAFDTRLRQVLNAYIDDYRVPNSDGIAYAGRCADDTNMDPNAPQGGSLSFSFIGTPNADYADAFVVEYVDKC